MKTPSVRPYDYRFLQTYLASPGRICGWNHTSPSRFYFLSIHRLKDGEVTAASTYDYKNLKPTERGLFCEMIFGALSNKRSRRSRPGYIQLASPAMHVWFLKGTLSYAAALTNRKRKHLERLVYAGGFTPHHNASFQGFIYDRQKPVYPSWQDTSYDREVALKTGSVRPYHVTDLVKTNPYKGIACLRTGCRALATPSHRRTGTSFGSPWRTYTYQQVLIFFFPEASEPAVKLTPVQITKRKEKPKIEGDENNPAPQPMSVFLFTAFSEHVYPRVCVLRRPAWTVSQQVVGHARTKKRGHGACFVSDAWRDFYFLGTRSFKTGLVGVKKRAVHNLAAKECDQFQVHQKRWVGLSDVTFDNHLVLRTLNPKPVGRQRAVNPAWQDFCARIQRGQWYGPTTRDQSQPTPNRFHAQDEHSILPHFHRQAASVGFKNVGPASRTIRCHGFQRNLANGSGATPRTPDYLAGLRPRQFGYALQRSRQSGWWASYLYPFIYLIGANHLSLNCWYNTRRPTRPTRLAPCKSASIHARGAWKIAYDCSDVAYSPPAPIRTMVERKRASEPVGKPRRTRRITRANGAARKKFTRETIAHRKDSARATVARRKKPTRAAVARWKNLVQRQIKSSPRTYVTAASTRLNKRYPRHPLASVHYANWIRDRFTCALKKQTYLSNVKRCTEPIDGAARLGEKHRLILAWQTMATGDAPGASAAWRPRYRYEDGPLRAQLHVAVRLREIRHPYVLLSADARSTTRVSRVTAHMFAQHRVLPITKACPVATPPTAGWHWRKLGTSYDIGQLIMVMIFLMALNIFPDTGFVPWLKLSVLRGNHRRVLVPILQATLQAQTLTIGRFLTTVPLDFSPMIHVWLRFLWHHIRRTRGYLQPTRTDGTQPLNHLQRTSLYAMNDETAGEIHRRRACETAHRLESHLKLDATYQLPRHCVTPSLFVMSAPALYDPFQRFFNPGAETYDRVNATYVERSLTFANSATGAGVIKLQLDHYGRHRWAFRHRLRLMQRELRFYDRRTPELQKTVHQNPWAHNMTQMPVEVRDWTLPLWQVRAQDEVREGREAWLWPAVPTFRQLTQTARLANRAQIYRAKLTRLFKILRPFANTRVEPGWMVLRSVPVCPPDIRPMVALDDHQMAVSDLNKFYQQILLRKNRQMTAYENRDDFRLMSWDAEDYTRRHYNFNHYSTRVCHDGYVRFLQKLTQQGVDNLIENGKADAVPLTASNDRPLKSLSDNLKGKKGRFRQNLLGKRVDYSGRSVIVVGPTLRLHECGLPVTMALVLFQHHLIRTVLRLNTRYTYANVKAMVQARHPHVLRVLKKLVESRPVLLNRAPTLHRLGVQAFKAKLVSGCAILLHPLVCGAFNADFDGDQMAVHIPVTPYSSAEAWKLMWGTNHLRSVATGDALLLPSQDMVLGCYYLTAWDRLTRWKCVYQSVRSHDPTLETLSQVERLTDLNLHTVVWLRWSAPLELDRVQRPFEFQITVRGQIRGLYPDATTVTDRGLTTTVVKTTAGRALAHATFRQSLTA